jgi:hypothetical protein
MQYEYLHLTVLSFTNVIIRIDYTCYVTQFTVIDKYTYCIFLMDWVTVKTQLLYCSISYLFIVFVGFIAFIAVLVQTTCFGPSTGLCSGAGGGLKHVVCARTVV